MAADRDETAQPGPRVPLLTAMMGAGKRAPLRRAGPYGAAREGAARLWAPPGGQRGALRREPQPLRLRVPRAGHVTAKMAALGAAVLALLCLGLGLGPGPGPGLGPGRAMAAVPLVIWHGMGEPRRAARGEVREAAAA